MKRQLWGMWSELAFADNLDKVVLRLFSYAGPVDYFPMLEDEVVIPSTWQTVWCV